MGLTEVPGLTVGVCWDTASQILIRHFLCAQMFLQNNGKLTPCTLMRPDAVFLVKRGVSSSYAFCVIC